ncbi:hypothetical protein PILCRDRAFT_822023 [Piloderma croceum F 1598]|uniref:NADP-dependent oxidoreductase domain-containing protein n=1 Tax=Piloderma croceum (strain F 1598) TaxID=765440 RepID=A0A0C3FLZ3_PILCF|nr:hypothetical protein PILCRDRAFT_822023 [Piloderma croceum F 1598]
MVHKSTNLGGTASNVEVAKIAHGLMMMTFNAARVPDEQSFEAIKASLDSVPKGTKMVLNSGEFYGPNSSAANLELLARFFHKYPEYAEKAFLSVKGGTKLNSLVPDSSPENLRRSVDYINEKLGGTKRIDLYECARIDPKVPVEETIKTLVELIEENKFDHIGLSEVSAETLRRGNAVHPIAMVEIEVSPWSYEEETKKVIATAKELNITVAAYSPLGRGFLTGQIKKSDDLPEGDFRRSLVRFKDENMKHNIMLVDALTAIAKKKGVTPAQLSIAWVSSLGPHVVPLPGSSHSKRTLENLDAGNIDMTPEDISEINDVIENHEVQGDRYFGIGEKAAHLWG